MNDHVLLANKFCRGEYTNDIDGHVWRAAFEFLLDNVDKIYFNKDEIHTLWTVNGGHIRRKIRNDDLVLSVLKISLPGYQGDGLTLYRGECRFLYESHQIGFCWSPEIEVASMFARGLNALESGGVLLKAYASQQAILASPNRHSSEQMQEFEYTCDPNLLENLEVIRFFEKPTQSTSA